MNAFKVLTYLAVAAFTFPTASVAAAQPGRPQHLTLPDEVPQGLSTLEWSNIRQQYEQHRHTAFPVAGGFAARNPGQQWLTRFDGRGFTTQPEAGGWQWGLELQSYGFPGHERVIAPDAKSGRLSVVGQRVACDWDDTLQEWFVNDQRGLEHGFTVKDRPVGAPSIDSQPSTLNLLLAVRGTLRPEVVGDGRGVRFVDAHSAAALSYSELTVLDADGRKLPARFEPVAGGLRLVVEERGARYPLTIDPIAQQAYLKASNTGEATVLKNRGAKERWWARGEPPEPLPRVGRGRVARRLPRRKERVKGP